MEYSTANYLISFRETGPMLLFVGIKLHTNRGRNSEWDLAMIQGRSGGPETVLS